MIRVKLAKSAMEHEEGMNHLWIQLDPIGDVQNAKIQIKLPAGVHRHLNLNGFTEMESGEIIIDDPLTVVNVLIEIFTREPIRLGEKTIIIALTYRVKEGYPSRIEHFFPLNIVDEDEIDNVSIDEEVVNKLKLLKQYDNSFCGSKFIEYTPMKILRIDPNHCSDLEKKYRIEY